MSLDYVKLYDELAKDEDIRTFPYDDKTGKNIYLPTGGKVTIGIGRNLTDRGLSSGEIKFLFRNDIILIEEQLDSELPWWRDHTNARQHVLANLCFNLGINGLLKFKNTLAAFQRSDWEGVVDGLRKSKWYDDVGPGRAGRLFKLVREG